MIRRTLSARSRGTTPNRSPHRGFSLVEVMMSVVLLAVGAALAIPSYQDMVENRQESTETRQVASISYSQPDQDNRCFGPGASEIACGCSQSDSLASGDCSTGTRPFILNNVQAADLDPCGDNHSNNVPGFQACPKQEEPES